MGTVASLSRKSSAGASSSAAEVVRHDDTRVTADQAAATASIRTLGTGAAQACAGNDSRLSDSRTPTGTAGGALNGTFPNPALDTVPHTPVALTDASTISVDASLGTHFRVTLGGNRTLGNPTNLSDGQRLLFEITQDGTGSRTLAYGSKYRFSSDLPQPTLSTAPGQVDYLGFVYRTSTDKLDLLGKNQGFG